MKRIINFILQHFLVVAVGVTFSVVIFRELTAPDFNLIEVMEKNNANWGAGVVFIVIASLLLLSSRCFHIRKLPNRKITNGLIIETEYNFSASNRYAYFRYWVDDVPYVLKSPYMSQMFYKGDYWRIAYNEKNPSQAILMPMRRVYVIAGCMSGFGLFNIILDLFFL